MKFFGAALLVATLLAANDSRAQDEPGMEAPFDEPGPRARANTRPAPRGASSAAQNTEPVPDTAIQAAPEGMAGPTISVGIAGGLSSLVVDPDVENGVAGGLFVDAWFWRHIGVEAAVFAAYNPYVGQLGDIGSSFSGGSISLGPMVRWLSASASWELSAGFAPGFFYVAPAIQQSSWNFGFTFTAGLCYRPTQWLGFGVKLRYSLFNLAQIEGPELVDLKSFHNIGIVDRLEFPAYVAFSF